jgi:hypothetical protein
MRRVRRKHPQLANEPGMIGGFAYVSMAAEGRVRLDGQSQFANLAAA